MISRLTKERKVTKHTHRLERAVTHAHNAHGRRLPHATHWLTLADHSFILAQS